MCGCDPIADAWEAKIEGVEMPAPGANKVERMTQEDRDLMREDLGDYSHHMR